MDQSNFAGMPLTQAVKTWMDGRSWSDPIEVNADRTASTVDTTLTIQEQVYKVLIQTLETEQAVFVYFYTAYLVPRHRLDALARILNRINFLVDLGRIACEDGPAARPIEFKAGFDVDGSTLSPLQVDILIGLGVDAFRTYGNVLAATALTNQTIDELWMEFLAGSEDERHWSRAKVTRQLH